MMVEKINNMIKPTLTELGFELVGCEFESRKGGGLLRVYVESEKGVNIDDCAIISRQISAILDVEDPISSQYHLEVSSPGLERPLFTLEHFQRFVGRQAKLRIRRPIAGQRNFVGTLASVDGDIITLSIDQAEPIQLAFDNIEKAHLALEDKQ